MNCTNRIVAAAAGAIMAAFGSACGSVGPDEDPNVAHSVEVVPASFTLHLNVNALIQLNAIARNKAGVELTGRSAAWASGSSDIASVSAAGVVTAVGLGTTSVTATVDGVQGSATITVSPAPVATVTLSVDKPVLFIGGTATATAGLRDAAGQPVSNRAVTFTSSNSGVATISETRLITALAAGATTITATSETKSGVASLCVLVPTSNLRIDQVVLTQAVQTLSGSLPLVAGGLPAEVRAHASMNIAPAAGCPPSRVRLIAYDGQVESFREEVDASTQPPTGSNPLSLIARFTVASALLTPSLRLLVEIDPRDDIPETATNDNTWPASGTPGPVNVIPVPPLELRFVPIQLANGGSVGLVNDASIAEYLFATRQYYPVSTINWDRGETMTSGVAFEGGEQGPWLQILAEMDMKRVIEGSRRYYVGALRPPPGVTFTQFGGFGYVPGNLASTGPGTRTSVLIGVGWFTRVRQTTELVAHELGHNHGRRHAPCGGAAAPDPAFPYAGGTIGVPGTDMYTWSQSGGTPIQLAASTTFDVMSYCAPAWVSDYTYQGLLAARLAAGPVAATVAGAGVPCECLVVWGTIHGDSVVLNPAFVTHTVTRAPLGGGAFRIEGVREDGSIAFSHAFEPAEIDHASDVRHFAIAIPVSQSDRESLASLRTTGRGRNAVLHRIRGNVGESLRAVAGRAAFRTLPSSDRAEVSWPRESIRGALVRNARTGAVLAISSTGAVVLNTTVEDVDVTLSDGVRSATVRLRRANR